MLINNNKKKCIFSGTRVIKYLTKEIKKQKSHLKRAGATDIKGRPLAKRKRGKSKSKCRSYLLKSTVSIRLE